MNYVKHANSLKKNLSNRISKAYINQKKKKKKKIQMSDQISSWVRKQIHTQDI